MNSCLVRVFSYSLGSGRLARGGPHARVAPQCAWGIVLGTGCKFGRPASASAAVRGTRLKSWPREGEGEGPGERKRERERERGPGRGRGRRGERGTGTEGGRVQRKMPKVRVLCIQQGLKSLESLLVVCASSLAAYVIDVRHFDILGM